MVAANKLDNQHQVAHECINFPRPVTTMIIQVFLFFRHALLNHGRRRGSWGALNLMPLHGETTAARQPSKNHALSHVQEPYAGGVGEATPEASA